MATISTPTWLLFAAAGAFVAGVVGFHASSPAWGHVRPGPATARQGMVANCHAVDGDTLRCGAERVRLIGIDSPELPGHCRRWRHCVAGDPYAAKMALGSALRARMPIRRFGKDRYGRTLALVRGRPGDLSCTQWRSGHAIYRADWDVNGQMKRGCS